MDWFNTLHHMKYKKDTWKWEAKCNDLHILRIIFFEKPAVYIVFLPFDTTYVPEPIFFFFLKSVMI